MPMFARATIPLIIHLREAVENIHHIWYAYDACGVGKLNKLREWWDVNLLRQSLVTIQMLSNLTSY